MPWQDELTELTEKYAESTGDLRNDFLVQATGERGSLLSAGRMKQLRTAAIASVSTGTMILGGLGIWFLWSRMKKRRK